MDKINKKPNRAKTALQDLKKKFVGVKNPEKINTKKYFDTRKQKPTRRVRR